MPTIAAGASTAVVVAVGTYLNGSGPGNAVIGAAAVFDPLTAGEAWQIGPFDRATSVSITASGAITYEVKDVMRTPSEADKLPVASVAAVQALVSGAWTADGYTDEAWQIITATGLAIPSTVYVKAAKLISGTSPTLVLRDALTDTYTATSVSTDVVIDLPATVTPGDEFPVNRLFRMAVHATVGGTSPVWAIKV